MANFSEALSSVFTRNPDWTDVLTACDALSASEVTEAAAALAAAIVDTLEACADSRTSDAMITSISSILQKKSIGSELALALVLRLQAATGGAKPAVVSAAGRTLALRAMCAALRGQFGALAAADGFNELVLSLGGLLHSIREANRRPALEKAAHSAACAMVAAVPEAGGRISTSLLSLDTPGEGAVALAGVLLDPRSRARPVKKAKRGPDQQGVPREPAPPVPPPLLTTQRGEWIALYASAVLGAAHPPSAHATRAFVPLLASATDDEWSTRILPASLKAMKRTPDAALAALHTCISALPPAMEMDGASASLLEALTPLILGTSVPRAALAASTVRVIMARCAAAAAVSGASILAATKPSALAGATQRAAFASSLSELATAARVGGRCGVAHASGACKEADQVVDALLPLAAKESTDATRVSLLHAAGLWLPLVSDSKSAVKELAKGLADKNAELRRGYVGAVLAALQNPLPHTEGGSATGVAAEPPPRPVGLPRRRPRRPRRAPGRADPTVCQEATQREQLACRRHWGSCVPARGLRRVPRAREGHRCRQGVELDAQDEGLVHLAARADWRRERA